MTAVFPGGRSLLAAFFVVCTSLFGVHSALAQGYPPPPPPTPSGAPESPAATIEPRDHRCARTASIRKNKNGKVVYKATTRFEPGQRIAVRGGNKCARPDTRVRASIDRDGESTRIGATRSGEKGSYTVTGRIPSSTIPGRHAIFVNTGNRTYVTDIEVSDADAKPSNFETAGPVLALWAALLGVIAAYVLSTRRRRRNVLAAVPVTPSELEVPVIDTWDFVGVLPSRHKRPPAGRSKAAGSPKGAKTSRPAKAKAKPAPRSKSAKPASAKAKAAPKRAVAQKKPVRKPAGGTNRKGTARRPAARGPSSGKATGKRKPPRGKRQG